METPEAKAFRRINELKNEYQERCRKLEKENKILKGEKSMPMAWWKDCPGAAQGVMERIMKMNRKLEGEILDLRKELSDCRIAMAAFKPANAAYERENERLRKHMEVMERYVDG